MSRTPSLIINQLILVGHRKNYIVPFNPGVNIIYGDADTGKSSILELVNYLLGAHKLNLYEEIELAVKYAVLEVEINDNPFTIQRDIFKPSAFIEVYRSSYDEIKTIYPEKFGPNYKREGPSGFFSDFLLEALGLPRVQLKQAPTKEDSKMIRFSFRDLFKYCYLNQDDVGSKKILDVDNFSVAVKNRETFKYIYSLLDSAISDLNMEISNKTNEKNKMTQKYTVVSEFFRETEFDTTGDIDSTLDGIDSSVEILQEKLGSLNGTMISDTESQRALKEILHNFNLKILETEEGKSNAELQIERYTRLKNDYRADLTKLRAMIEAKKLIGDNSEDVTNCPICDNELKISEAKKDFQICETDKIKREINSINKRIRDLSDLIESEKSKHYKATNSLKDLYGGCDKAKRMLDEGTSEMISPYLSERDGILTEISTLKEKREHLYHFLKMRNQLDKTDEAIKQLDKGLTILNEKLKSLKENAPSPEVVFADLGVLLNRYLKYIHIKNRKKVGINETDLLPTLRNKKYKELNSGGLRTIVSIGYLLSFIEYSLKEGRNINLPRFLMIDTVGKYLGKTQQKYLGETSNREDEDEAIADPSKYKNIYEYIIDIAIQAESKGQKCQFLLVDNDVPPSIQKEYAGFVVAHFSANGESGLPIGLIDDAQ